MKRKQRVLLAGVLCSAGLWLGATSVASAATAWVAGQTGSGTACTRSQPCATITQGLAVAGNKGTVVIIEQAPYDAFTVTQSVTVTARGVTPIIAPTSGAAVTVSATASDMVTLRGLDLRGPEDGGTINGINFTSGGILNVKHCSLSGFNTAINQTSSGRLRVTNSTIRQSVGNTVGLLVTNGEASIGNTDFHGKDSARLVYGGGSGNITVHRCTLVGDRSTGSFGVYATLGTEIDVINSVIKASQYGIWSQTSGTLVRLFNSKITKNISGIVAVSGGQICWFGNNHIQGNDVNGSPTCLLSMS